MDAGFFVLCRGANSRSVFKLLLLDSSGETVIEEESSSSSSSSSPNKSTHTEAAIYCTRFETFRNVAPPPASPSDPSSLLSMLDNFQPCSISISTGQYLLCVQCTNILGLPTHFTVTTVLANAAVDALKSVDEEILSHKPSLDALRMEYDAAKAKYESAIRQLRDEGTQLTALLELKEKLHTAFVDSSIQAYRPDAAVSMEEQQESSPRLAPDDCAAVADPDRSDGVGQGTAVGLAVHAAAMTATQAWGGIARRWSLGVSQVKLFSNHSNVSSFVSSHSAAAAAAAVTADDYSDDVSTGTGTGAVDGEVGFDIDTSSGSEASSDESPVSSSPLDDNGDVLSVSLSAADSPSEA